MKKTYKIKISRVLVSLILTLSFVFGYVPVSAVSNKILVNDTDGDGEISIGDEFCLGEECFYVTDNDDGWIQALAKYNLYAGYNLIDKSNDEEFVEDLVGSSYSYKFMIKNGYINCNEDSKFGKTLCLEPIDYTIELNDEITGPTNDTYYLDENCDIWFYDSVVYENNTQQFDGVQCYNREYKIENPIQSSIAISKHGGSKETGSEYPEVGDYFFNDYTNYYKGESQEDIYMSYDFENNLTWNNFIYRYLDDYYDELNSLGSYEVDEVSLLSYNDLADILTAINSDKTFDHNGYFCDGEWYRDEDETMWMCTDAEYPYVWSYYDDDGDYTYVGRSGIKQFIPEQYDWLYSTTYWLRTAFINQGGDATRGQSQSQNYSTNYNYQFFIDTVGDLCYVDGQNGCNDPRIGAGIRPLISMSGDQFELNRMDINGTIRWIDENNASKVRPTKSVIKLYRNNNLISSIEVEKEAEEDLWRFSFPNLLKYDKEGAEYKYTITQDDIALYSSSVTNFDIVNKYAPDLAVPNTGVNQYTDGGVNSDAGLESLIICVSAIVMSVSAMTLIRKSKKISFIDKK